MKMSWRKRQIISNNTEISGQGRILVPSTEIEVIGIWRSCSFSQRRLSFALGHGEFMLLAEHLSIGFHQEMKPLPDIDEAQRWL